MKNFGEFGKKESCPSVDLWTANLFLYFRNQSEECILGGNLSEHINGIKSVIKYNTPYALKII